MKSILSSLFVGSLSEKSERTWLDALKLFIPFLFVLLTINYQDLPQITSPTVWGGHGFLSLNVAHQNAFCGKIGHTSHVISRTTDVDTPINKLAFQNEAQRVAYCATTKFVVLNETSLSYLYTCIFKIYPSITLSQINILFNFLKLSIIALFAFLLFRLGLSPIYILFISILSHFFIYNIDQRYILTIYTFFIPNYLFLLTLSAFYLYGLRKYSYRFIPFGFIIGVDAAFYCNFRTSHSIIVLYILSALLVFIYFLMKGTLGSRLKTFLFVVLSFATFYIGFQSYNSTFLTPINEIAKIKSSANYTYHTVTHPLVLALGIKPSALTTREGIRWHDSVGLPLAQKVDPSVGYLTKNYDKALLIYYLKLWLYFSEEMLEIYTKKFTHSTTLKHDLYMKHLKTTNLNAPVIAIIGWLQSNANAYWKVWMILLGSFGLLGLFYRKFSVVGLFVSFSIVGSCFLLLWESNIIMHLFILTYHSLVNLLFVMILLYYVQIMINLLYRVFVNYQKQRGANYAR